MGHKGRCVSINGTGKGQVRGGEGRWRVSSKVGKGGGLRKVVLRGGREGVREADVKGEESRCR